jgi:ferredoxin-NADP reductase
VSQAVTLDALATTARAKDTPRKRIRDLEAMVADVIPETFDTTTLVLFTGNERLEYQPGHFLTIDPHQFEALDRFIAYLEDQKQKKEPPRAYSIASAPHERHLALTIKEERYASGMTKYPPLLSPLLAKRTMRGMRLEITGFTGPYVLPQDVESTTDHLVHVCAGSGSVPNFSILKHALEQHPKLRHTFIYSNKTWDSVIYARELDRISAKHPGKVRLVHTLTREQSDRADVHHGRLSKKLLADLIPDPTTCLAFVCGPGITPHEKAEAKKGGPIPQPRFLETALSALEEIGVPRARIKHESYG